MAHFLIDVIQRHTLTRRLTHGVWATDLATALAAQAPPDDDNRWTDQRNMESEESRPHVPADDEWMTVAKQLSKMQGERIWGRLADRGIRNRVDKAIDGWEISVSKLQLTDAFVAVATAPATRQEEDGRDFGRHPRPRADGMETAAMIAPEPARRPYRITQERYVTLDSPFHGGEQMAHVVLTDGDGRDTEWSAWGFGTLAEDAERAAYEAAVAISEATPDDRRTDDAT